NTKYIYTFPTRRSSDLNISDITFKRKIESIFKINKYEYTSNTVWLATSISQVGQVSLNSTVECMRLIYEFLIGEPPQNWLTISRSEEHTSELQSLRHLV